MKVANTFYSRAFGEQPQSGKAEEITNRLMAQKCSRESLESIFQFDLRAANDSFGRVGGEPLDVA